MKLFFIAILLLTLMSCKPDPIPDPPAEGERISITWNMFSTDAVIGYKLYYSDNENMIGKVWHENCNTPTHLPLSTEEYLTNLFMTCNNFPIEHGDVLYLTLSAVTPDGELVSEVVPFSMQ